MSLRVPSRGLLVLSAFMTHYAFGQARFDVPVYDGNRPKLLLRGTTGSNYIFESSTDLKAWQFLFSGVAADGHLDYLDSPALASSHRFYRAYAPTATNAPPISVTPQLDSSGTITTLFSPLGGGADIFLKNGTRISLNAPSNVLAEAEQVTLTPVTNILKLPFSRGMIGAAKVDISHSAVIVPGTFGSAQLAIMFGPKVVTDRREVVSFACDSDGTNFRLVPDNVRTNQATLVPTRSGIYGCALATAEELDQIGARIPTAEPAESRPAKPGTISALDASDLGFLTASVKCFPERVQHAIEVAGQLDRGMDVLAERAALARARDRRNQPADASEDAPPSVEQAGKDLCDFYNFVVKPQFPQAAQNCALIRVLSRVTASLKNQIQILGYSGCTPSVADLPTCAGARACLEEIKECCGKNPLLSDDFALDLVSITSQIGRSDASCISEAEKQKVFLECGKHDWSGSLKISLFGIDFYEFFGTLIVRTRILLWEGVVTGVDELGRELTLHGNYSVFDQQLSVRSACCGTIVSASETTGQGSLSLDLTVQLDAFGPNTYLLGYAQSPVMDPVEMRSYGTSCNGCDPGGGFSNKPIVGIATLPSPGTVQGTYRDDIVQGSTEVNTPLGRSPGKIKFEWYLIKRTPP